MKTKSTVVTQRLRLPEHDLYAFGDVEIRSEFETYSDGKHGAEWDATVRHERLTHRPAWLRTDGANLRAATSATDGIVLCKQALRAFAEALIKALDEDEKR